MRPTLLRLLAWGVAVLAASCAAPAPPSRPPTVKVAAVQCSSTFGAVEANREKLSALVREAAANGAKIVVLPETAVTGYLSQDLRLNWHVEGRPLEDRFEGRDPATAAETVPGPSTDHFCTLARELGVYVTVPLLEVEQGEHADGTPWRHFFNTVCLAAPSGELVAHYRKLSPWPYPEKSWATPGDRGPQTYDTEYGRVGLAICFDIHTILDLYDEHELWALLYPIAWVSDGHPERWFGQDLPARVADHGLHLIGANWSVDRPSDWYGYGYSTIVSADGEVLAQATALHDSEIVYATLPTATLRD